MNTEGVRGIQSPSTLFKMPRPVGGELHSRMKFRVLEHRDFLVGRTYENKPAYDYKKHGPYAQTEWEIRPHWVLEQMINDPNYVYSKRIFYVDATPADQGGSYMLDGAEYYDQKGRLWKAGGIGAPSTSGDGANGIFSWTGMNYQTDHYTVLDVSPSYDIPGVIPLKERFSLSRAY